MPSLDTYSYGEGILLYFSVTRDLCKTLHKEYNGLNVYYLQLYCVLTTTIMENSYIDKSQSRKATKAYHLIKYIMGAMLTVFIAVMVAFFIFS